MSNNNNQEKKKDRRIRLSDNEIKMISKALNFYKKNGGTAHEIELREKHSFMEANTNGLAWRFETLAGKGYSQAPSRGRKYYKNRPVPE